MAVAAAAVCCVCLLLLQKAKDAWLSAAARGHRYLPPVGPLLSVEVPIAWGGYVYSFSFSRMSPDSLGFTINKQKGQVYYRKQTDGSFLLSVYTDPPQEQQEQQQQQQEQQQQQQQGPRLLRFRAREEALGLRLDLGGDSLMVLDQRDPTELLSDVNGRLVRYLVQDGDTVKKGQPFAEVEAMKMILTLTVSLSTLLIHRRLSSCCCCCCCCSLG